MPTANLTAVALRHVAFEDLGTFAKPIRERGYSVVTLDCGVDDLQVAEEADLVAVLGGPIGAYEQDRYPWLADELALLRRRISRGMSTLGICLGAQLIAAAMGGRVEPGEAGKEIGFHPIRLTRVGESSPLRHLSADRCVPLHWHGDTFDIPPGAVRLAGSDLYPNQAFMVGDHALAVQFHPEFDARRIEQWLVGHACELASAGTDLQALRTDGAKHGVALARHGALMIGEWLDGLPRR